jgi:hypothetical protein
MLLLQLPRRGILRLKWDATASVVECPCATMVVVTNTMSEDVRGEREGTAKRPVGGPLVERTSVLPRSETGVTVKVVESTGAGEKMCQLVVEKEV